MHDEAVLPEAMIDDDAAGLPGRRRGLLFRAIDRLLRRHAIGGLRLTLPSGATALLGTDDRSAGVDMSIRSWRALWRIARRGAIGFAERYMAGEIDTDDLRSLFQFFYANEAALSNALRRFNDTRPRDRRYHSARSNTRTGSRRNIAAHYDIGNDFYRLWLDESLFYSSGIFPDPNATLEEAQAAKLRRILSALDLSAGTSLLEVGCGWGALALAAGRQGADVTAITLSEQQLATARQRLAATGGASVEFRLEDYRDIRGTFDRLVSVEMIEAVGEDHWSHFFDMIAARLAPTGMAVIQAITIHDEAFARYRANPDFIQRYIFPGGMLPTVSRMTAHAAEAGLAFATLECFGASYALTLAEWRRRFEARWPEIEALGFDDRFRRMWRYYLTYCEVGFERGLIDVGLYRLHKPV